MRHTPPIRASAFQNDVKQVERNAYGAKRAVAEVREKMDRYRQRKDAQQLLPKIAAAERAVDALYAELPPPYTVDWTVDYQYDDYSFGLA